MWFHTTLRCLIISICQILPGYHLVRSKGQWPAGLPHIIQWWSFVGCSSPQCWSKLAKLIDLVPIITNLYQKCKTKVYRFQQYWCIIQFNLSVGPFFLASTHPNVRGSLCCISPCCGGFEQWDLCEMLIWVRPHCSGNEFLVWILILLVQVPQNQWMSMPYVL